MDLRDYFISYNSADEAHAEAINTALRDAGYETHFAGTDCPPGTNIPIWMNRALAGSRQMLALCSPDYFKEGAVYSLMERMAALWGDPDGSLARLVPVEIAACEYDPLIAPLARIMVSGMTPDAAAAALVAKLAKGAEAKRREELRTAEAAPEVFHVPRGRNTEFSGHFDALGAIHRTLSQGQNAAVTQAISGLGGIGKTTLAAEYAHRFGTKGRYGGVWWVAAETDTGIVEGLAGLARRIGREERQNLPEMAREARDFLQAQTPPWLVIFDNATDADTVRDWLPAGSARVLITSRAHDFAGLAEVTRLDEWDATTTADYLLRVAGRDDRAGAEALAGKLGGLPLAANQAAAFLKARPGIGFGQYVEDFEKLLDRARDPGNRGDYPETVFATLVKSLEVLPEATQDLMCLLAWLSPDGVEEGLLAAAAEKRPEFLPGPLGAALRDDYARADLVKAALDLSLLKTGDEPGVGQMLIVHRVVQAVLRVWQRAEGKAGWDVRAAQIVNGVFPEDPVNVPKDWPLCARLLPHARALAEHGPRQGAGAEALGRLLNQAGVFLHSRGDTEGAIAMLEPNVELAAAIYGEEHLNYCAALSNLAGRYTDAGRLDEAERGFLRVLEIEEKLLDPDDPSLAITLNNLGEVYWKRQDFARAEPLFQRAAEINKKANGPESVEYGWRLNALGVLYNDW
ncbi:MAG: tetratricopeptide repeat protein, partial [Proteobacteria bacterium]|nr:tetratricopeptide repeat protein [Pseudomonadota bacterium]